MRRVFVVVLLVAFIRWLVGFERKVTPSQRSRKD